MMPAASAGNAAYALLARRADEHDRMAASAGSESKVRAELDDELSDDADVPEANVVDLAMWVAQANQALSRGKL